MCLKGTFRGIIKYIFLAFILCICSGLFIQASSKGEKIIFLMLILMALFINKRLKYTVFLGISVFASVMIYCSIREIPQWGARTWYIGTDSVWGRDEGYVDSLIYTLISDKKCIIQPSCWYYDYIYTFAGED